MTHKIRIEGFAGPHESLQVVAAFAQLFRIPEDRARLLLERVPLVIKEGLDEVAADKYRQNLERIGLRVTVVTPMSLTDELVLAIAGEASAAARVAALAEQTAHLVAPLPGEGVAPPTNPPAPATPAEQPGFRFRIEGRPDFAFLTVALEANQTLKVEASAMATMDTSLRMKTKLKGGLGRFLTGESLFVNEFTAENVPGEIGIAPGAPGDLAHVYLRNETLYLQNSAFVACDPAVNLETKWQGFTKGFFSGESFFLVRASGQGDLWFNTYGGLIELDVDGDYVVDTGNIVAFTDGLEYNIGKVGGYKSLFFSGEGLVCRFSGKGKVWIQTRSPAAFVSWAHWFRPVQKSN
ncbi:MAG: TIGR00266 family protein [Pseudomonadota bacterium]